MEKILYNNLFDLDMNKTKTNAVVNAIPWKTKYISILFAKYINKALNTNRLNKCKFDFTIEYPINKFFKNIDPNLSLDSFLIKLEIKNEKIFVVSQYKIIADGLS